MRDRQYVIVKRRSEQGKKIRSQYKNDIGIPYCLSKGYSLMLNGYSGAITTFTTDNQILEIKNNIDMELTYHEHPTKEDLLEYFSQRIRVRKMHQTEAFRLMDVDDADIEKIQAYPFASFKEREIAMSNADPKELSRIKRESIAKTAQYKLAGNSIVVACLYHIFRTLFISNQPENNLPQGSQLTLFD